MLAWLATRRPRRGELEALGRAIGVSARTLRSWRSRGADEGRPGRPRRAMEEREEARALVARAWRELPAGHDGWRTVQAALARAGTSIATRLVQESVRELKQERRLRARRRVEVRREHVEVLARDAQWGVDETDLGRDDAGRVRALVVREGFVPCTNALSVGPPARGADVVAVLEQAAAERGGWPLVVAMDNGPANKATCVLERLEREQVHVLWNLPRTPEHNPRTERGIGDLKRALASEALAAPATSDEATTQGPVSSPEPGVAETRALLRARLEAARELLDGRVPRARLGGRTPRELDSLSTRADHLVCRARFHEDVRSELTRIQRAHDGARARRMAERDAIWNALQLYGLVTRTRGGRPVPARKPEGVL